MSFIRFLSARLYTCLEPSVLYLKLDFNCLLIWVKLNASLNLVFQFFRLILINSVYFLIGTFYKIPLIMHAVISGRFNFRLIIVADINCKNVNPAYITTDFTWLLEGAHFKACKICIIWLKLY